MTDPASILFSYAMDKNIFPQYIADYPQFQHRRKVNSAVLDHLHAQLDDPAKEELDAFMEEEYSLDALHLESAFTAGLALGLQLLRLL